MAVLQVVGGTVPHSEGSYLKKILIDRELMNRVLIGRGVLDLMREIFTDGPNTSPSRRAVSGAYFFW